MRRGRRKVGNRDKVFGCDLQEHLSTTAQEVPQVLRSCSEFIEEYGIVDGIYRLSGVSSNTQKLRSEFDTEGTPDLYKDVYLQDIHCVSSLCKAYFRELPNPLLTYELYDRFADAVAVQLEDERLVKIKEVLQDLPAPNYRTLEFLMHHLVKMSTYASQTNMHSRNLAIVWAPNLLRSKDIESTGFNGTAAFMEVRVQSIVVEFILTHVPELFPAPGLAAQRRKSLPSPSLLSNQDDHFQFKSLPFNCSGNLSPGDGPPPMRPYHAIIDGTDKRKGSLKGRKWKSIFNLGGRLHDPRKKSKYCPKEKENASLRPAKSMDSLSSGPFALEDSKHPPPLVLSSGNSEGVAPVGGGVSSGYAVTYRRTGGAQVSMVSGGTPGTYNRLDSGVGASGAEGSSQGMSRSPGMTSKADRRAGIHISGPFSVTVPLHITSGLALGVLHGGWTEKEQTMQEDAEEDQPDTEEDEGTGPEVKGAEPERKSADGNKTNDDVKESGGEMEGQVDCGKTTTQENVTLEGGDSPSTADAVKADLTQDQGSVTGNVENDLPPPTNEETADEDYMDMRGHLHQAPSEDMEDLSELPMDVQDAFGFLDLMDSCASYQLEFSVEPPFEEEEDEEEAERPTNPAFSSPVPNHSHDLEMPTANISTSPFTHRPLPGKSFSLPYKSRPFMPALSLSSDEEESSPDEDEDSDKGSEYEDMFCQSLPSSRDFQGLSWLDTQTAGVTSVGGDVDALSSNQSKCLDETHIILPSKNIEDLQSISQSEDMILTATTLTDNSVTSADQSVNEKRLSGDSKTEHLNMEEKNEENKSEDVNYETHTMTGKDGLESMDSDEDTYFGPDPIPSPPEPSSHEPVPVQFPGVEAQQMLDNTESEIIVTDEVTATDFTSLAAQDEVKTSQPPEEEEKIFHEGKIDEGEEKIREPEEGETEVEAKMILHERKISEGEEKIREPEEGETEEEEKKIFHERKISEGEEKIREPEEGETEVEEKSEKTVEVGDKILEASQLKTTEHEETWRENEENPQEEVQEIKECVNNINKTVENGEREEEHAQNESVNKVAQEGVEMENSLDETEIEKESNEKNIEGNEEDMNVNTDSSTREGNISCEGITDETDEDKEGILCRDDHEGSTLMQQPNEISCGKMEDRETEEQASEESSISTDEELLHSYVPEEERETTALDCASHKAPIQGKAVPVVPPKPQNSKLTALTLRKQFQHRDMERQHRHSQFMDTELDEKGLQHRDRCVKQEVTKQQHREQEHRDGNKQNENKQQADETVENCEKQLSETSVDGTSPEDGKKQEREALRESKGTSDAGIDLRKDLLREGEREVKRNSAISICFDEAVARATVKRNRESSERLSGAQWERAGKMD